jgi:hypothetical protein
VWCRARRGKLWLISGGWLSERQCFRDVWMQVNSDSDSNGNGDDEGVNNGELLYYELNI